MDEIAAVGAIARQIELAVTPVFLLAGVGAILNVLAQRLARVVDRSREIEAEIASLDEQEKAYARAELALLDRRMGAANAAISFCTASALFVCFTVAVLFVSEPSDLAFGRPLALLFIAAMALLIAGLVLFLYEVRLAARALRARRLHAREIVGEGK